METEIVELGAAAVAFSLVIYALRRASIRSQKQAPASARQRLGYDGEPEPARRRRRRDAVAASDREPSSTSGQALPSVADVPPPAEAAEAAATDDPEAAAAYKAGLEKTRGGFVAKISKLFGKKQIDADTLDSLEEALYTADIGPRAAERIFRDVKSGLSRTALESPAQIWNQIRKTSKEILTIDAKPVDLGAHKPFVLLVLGVNGVGKTTTIGKLAARWQRDGHKVLLAAGDTFRAAATEQLEAWSDRAGVSIVKGKPNGDPSSVIFDAIKKAIDENYDVVICDTAGRLHSNSGLMDELKKLRRVCDKALPGAPHETWMVLDATTGQNAISQAKTFKTDMEISGIVLTKLDGSAKGGVVLGICDELNVPVRFIGIGETIDALRPFEPAAFVEALYPEETVGG